MRPGLYRIIIGGGRPVYTGSTLEDARQAKNVLELLQYGALVDVEACEVGKDNAVYGRLGTGGWLMLMSKGEIIAFMNSSDMLVNGSEFKTKMLVNGSGVRFVERVDVLLQLAISGEASQDEFVVTCTNMAGIEVASLSSHPNETFGDFSRRLAAHVEFHDSFEFVTQRGVRLTEADNDMLCQELLSWR